MDRLGEALYAPVAAGLRAELFFGVLEGAAGKDGVGSCGDAGAPVPAACAYLRARATHSCLLWRTCACAATLTTATYGIVQACGAIDIAVSVARLATSAAAFARAGAQIIAPSDMMDRRVDAIKAAPRGAGLGGATAVKGLLGHVCLHRCRPARARWRCARWRATWQRAQTTSR